MKKNKLVFAKRKLLILYFSFVFAILLSLIPWDYIRAADFYDRTNYINYIDLYSNKVQWFDFSGFLTKITYEWGWHYLLNYLESNLGLNSTVILFLLSLFTLTTASAIIGFNKNIYAVFLLVNPLYINFFYSQIRLSVAIAFIYLSVIFFERSRIFSIVILIPSLFIHTSSFLFVFIFYSAIILNKIPSLSPRFKFSFALIVGFIAAFVTGPYMSILLGSIDDRRTEYSDMSAPAIYMIYWNLLFLFFVLKYLLGRIGSFKHYYFYITISILTMVFLNIFLTGYASRFVAASFPFLVLAISELKGKNESIIKILYVLYTIVLWFFWLT